MSHSGSGSGASSSKYCGIFVIMKCCFRLLSVGVTFAWVVIGIALISIYLLPNNKSNNQRTQDTVIEWIKEANKKGIIPIVMGDFNHDEKKKM